MAEDETSRARRREARRAVRVAMPRPTGQAYRLIGTLGLWLGGLLIALVVGARLLALWSTAPGAPFPQAALAIGLALVGFGFGLVTLGAFLRALWHLPGRFDEEPDAQE